MRIFKRHENKLGYHFSLPFNPHHIFTLDLVVGRINLFWPFFVSVSFGLLGKKVFQVYAGIKFDPTETEKLGENDYLFSAVFRRIQTGKNCRVNSEASF